MRPALALTALLLSACATTGPLPLASGAARCEQLLQQADAAVDVAQVGDAGAHRVPGFAWARSNRFLASFADDLSPAQVDDWLAQLRALDRQARSLEMTNLQSHDWPAAVVGQLQRCGDLLMARTAGRPDQLNRLRRAVAVPDDYSILARTFGVYPLSMPLLRLGVLDYQAQVQKRFKAELPEAQGQWRLWRVAGADRRESIHWGRLPRNALGMVQLSKAQRDGLLRAHAPHFLIDQVGAFDQPGLPQPEPDGGLQFDAEQPVLHQQLVWTRLGAQVLPQLVYTLWFSQRPAEGALDPYAGTLDGVVWRITLDAQGEVLLHDTVHACGCYHYHFPAQNRPRQTGGGGISQEPLLFPQGQIPWSEIAVVLQSGTHYVQRVLPLISARQLATDQARLLELRPYDELRSVQRADSAPRSLFGPDGLVAGSERLERYWLWPSGVPSPGTMRQWGRHATAFIGRAHFDDPFFLHKLGLRPQAAGHDTGLTP